MMLRTKWKDKPRKIAKRLTNKRQVSWISLATSALVTIWPGEGLAGIIYQYHQGDVYLNQQYFIDRGAPSQSSPDGEDSFVDELGIYHDASNGQDGWVGWIFASGTIYVTGTISLNGGDGGDGDYGVIIPEGLPQNARAPRGGDGGNGGTLLLQAPNIVFEFGSGVSLCGGRGGNGGYTPMHWCVEGCDTTWSGIYGFGCEGPQETDCDGGAGGNGGSGGLLGLYGQVDFGSSDAFPDIVLNGGDGGDGGHGAIIILANNGSDPECFVDCYDLTFLGNGLGRPLNLDGGRGGNGGATGSFTGYFVTFPPTGVLSPYSEFRGGDGGDGGNSGYAIDDYGGRTVVIFDDGNPGQRGLGAIANPNPMGHPIGQIFIHSNIVDGTHGNHGQPYYSPSCP
jgi:hypothetical protein